MKTLVIVVLILLGAAMAAREAAALEATAPSPEQAAPSLAAPRETLGVWQFPTIPQGVTRQCRVAAWSLVRYWHTDQWGHTSTWLSYVPASYVCF